MSENVNVKKVLATERNRKARAEKHQKFLAANTVRPKVPRGTARNLRRKAKQLAWAELHGSK